MFWSANASRCLAVSTLSATEASAVASNWLCSAASACSEGADPGGDVDHLLGERVQPARRVDDQVTQLLEGLALRVQLLIGLRRSDDHPGQQIAALLRRLGDGVVEDLADVERLRQRRLGVGDRAAEWFGLRGAEFLDGQSQFVVAGADRVVDVHDDRLGQIVEGVDRHRGQRVGVSRVHSLRGGELGFPPLAPPAPHPQPQQQDRDDDDREHDEQAEPRHPDAGAGRTC